MGLDFGSTTSGIVVASTQILNNCVTGRAEFGEVEIRYRPEPVFTPFLDDSAENLSTDLLERQIHSWFSQSGVDFNFR